MPHGVVLVGVSQQKYSFSQLGLGTCYLQLGSSQPNKETKTSLIAAQSSAYLNALHDSCVADEIKVAGPGSS